MWLKRHLLIEKKKLKSSKPLILVLSLTFVSFGECIFRTTFETRDWWTPAGVSINPGKNPFTQAVRHSERNANRRVASQGSAKARLDG